MWIQLAEVFALSMGAVPHRFLGRKPLHGKPTLRESAGDEEPRSGIALQGSKRW